MQFEAGLSEQEACAYVALEFPTVCGACNPPTNPNPIFCQCRDCTSQVWERNANGFTCGDRILYLQTTQGFTEEQACTFVSEEYGGGICGPYCNPEKCDGQCQAKPYTPAPTAAPLPINNVDLYCFPPLEQRVQYTNVWSKYILQVKESPMTQPCGPGPNLFSRKAIFYNSNRQILRLEYRYINNNWQGSEGRIIIPDGESPFSYGEYSFQIQSVLVRRGSTILGRKRLPPNLVIGMFTYDPNVASQEAPYNREIDLEISQWGDTETGDIQFLAQPDRINGPHFPQNSRFFSGGKEGRYAVGVGRFYNFTWSPNAITWRAEVGSGVPPQVYRYESSQAKESCAEDYVQCPGSNVEVRVNLWNMWPLQGGSLAPDLTYLGDIGGNLEDIRVQVRIETFQYTRSDEQGAPDGSVCSRDCQCQSAYCNDGNCATIHEAQ